MTLRAEHTRATREALLAAARRLFTEQTYAATSTEEIVRAAGVTRGALYHHFGSKRGLFRAVYEDLEASFARDLTERVLAEPDPDRRLDVGLDLFLDACLDPALQRIALIDAPAVLEWEEWRGILERYGLGLVRTAIQGASEEGALKPVSVDALAHLLLGALTEAGLTIARSNDVEATRSEIGETMYQLLAGLRQEPRRRGPPRRR